AFGFGDPEFEYDLFAALVYANAIPGARDEICTLHDPHYPSIHVPIIIRRAFEMYHVPPTHPSSGRSACWAQSTRLTPPRNYGLRTAKHVLAGLQIHSTLSTTSGNGTVLDLGPDGIDAALFEPPGLSAFPKATTLNVVNYVAPWTDVQFET